MRARLLAAAFALLFPLAAGAEAGLLDLSVEPTTGRIELRLTRFPAEFIYVAALQSGVGSNDLGLDRGMLDRTRLIRFERLGNRVLMLEPNLGFRAVTDNPSERRAVEEAFAQSVLAGFDIGETRSDGSVTIDLEPLLKSDITRIGPLLDSLEQGSFQMDPQRSAIDTEGILNFPDNTLIPVVVTLTGTEAGDQLASVTPTPDSLTVRVAHQFIRLPESSFRPRRFHPRSGYFPMRFRDYAAPLEEPIEQRFIYRHSLAPGETLQYYVDNGTPEPVRSALLEGASWWREAFEAAGFPDGFRVDVLPEGADPLDSRYNVIQWVHRSTRGWSYGGSIADPRSGEIIKGHVSLGSLRVRQDQLIAEALTAPFAAPGEAPAAARKMALARLRQLSAHEVGHTLGIDHNFAASFSGDGSVMDYPHPNLYLGEDGRVQLNRAYRTGVSPWDILAVRYGYEQFTEGAEATGLAGILQEARDRNIAFLGDRDARVPGSAHPEAHLWDNSGHVLARLEELMTIREAALLGFSPHVLPPGSPLSEMERRLVPVYLLHRYQVEAAAKLLGGLHYDYAMKEDEATTLTPVDAKRQRQALAAISGLLQPERLALPENLRYRIPPPANGFERDREFFAGRTGMPFDHLAPARAGASLVIDELLQPQRLARLAEQHALDEEQPGISAVINALMARSLEADSPRDGYLAAIQQEINWLTVRGLMRLDSDATASNRVRERALAALVTVSDRLESSSRRGNDHATGMRREIESYFRHRAPVPDTSVDPVPPGSPIG